MTAPIFQHIPRIERFRRDLKLARIEYRDTQGRYADFHALRKTFGTNLQRNGEPSRTAMTLMRHSDRRLTDIIYTDESLLGVTQAVCNLPSFETAESETPSHIASHKTDANGQKPSTTVNTTGEQAKSETSETLDNKREIQPPSPTGKNGQRNELAGATGLETTPFCDFAQQNDKFSENVHNWAHNICTQIVPKCCELSAGLLTATPANRRLVSTKTPPREFPVRRPRACAGLGIACRMLPSPVRLPGDDRS